jgi:hypothetical protein
VKKRLLTGLFIGSLIGFFTGIAIAVWAYERLFAVGQPMARIAEAAEAAEYTYALYLFAPYPVAVEFLEREAALLERLAAESPEQAERESFLRELAINRTRLANLNDQHGDDAEVARLMRQAMVHLRESGSSWTESDLKTFVEKQDRSTALRSAHVYESGESEE